MDKSSGYLKMFKIIFFKHTQKLLFEFHLNTILPVVKINYILKNVQKIKDVLV